METQEENGTSSSKWKSFQLSLLQFNYTLYFTLFTRMLIPTFYTTFRVYILGSLPDTSSVSIASQMAWIYILLEIVQEGLLQPLYHCLGQSLTDRDITKNKVKTGFILCSVIYFVFSASVSLLASPLVTWMAQDESLHEETVQYIRLELLGIVASSLGKFLMLVMIMYEMNIMIFLTLVIQMVSSISLDYTLASEKLANLGITGVALSSIGTSILVLMANFIICWKGLRFDITDLTRRAYNFAWFRQWTRVGIFSALDSLIRNVVYLVVVLRAMNLLQHQDSYWVANTFIWSWLLLPALPLGDVIKQDVANSKNEVQSHLVRLSASYWFLVCIIILWMITCPAWYPFIEVVLSANDAELSYKLVLGLAPCYVFFIFQIPMISVFYALGKTDNLAFCSFIGNIFLVILYFFVFYGVLEDTIQVVAAIFGLGLVFGFFVVFFVYLRLKHKNPLI